MSLKSGRNKGKVLHSDARTMVFKVYSFLKELTSQEVHAKTAFLQTQPFIAKACGISVHSVSRILQHGKPSSLDRSTPLFQSPGKHCKIEKQVTNLDDIEKDVLRCKIYEMYDNGEYPMLKILVRLMRDKMKYRGSITSKRFISKNLGFKYK